MRRRRQRRVRHGRHHPADACAAGGQGGGVRSVLPRSPRNTPVLAVPVPADGFRLEGHVLRAVEAGHTDTDDSTALHVPSIDLVVAGDVVYNGVHQMMLEGGDGGLQAWLDGIDRIAALNPRHVVAGHKNKDLPDDPKILDETRQYLRDAIRILADKPTPLAFFDEMMSHGRSGRVIGRHRPGGTRRCCARRRCPAGQTSKPASWHRQPRTAGGRRRMFARWAWAAPTHPGTWVPAEA